MKKYTNEIRSEGHYFPNTINPVICGIREKLDNAENELMSQKSKLNKFVKKAGYGEDRTLGGENEKTIKAYKDPTNKSIHTRRTLENKSANHVEENDYKPRIIKEAYMNSKNKAFNTKVLRNELTDHAEGKTNVPLIENKILTKVNRNLIMAENNEKEYKDSRNPTRNKWNRNGRIGQIIINAE